MFKKLRINPGIIKDSTPAELEGHWSDSNLIRFQMGMPRTVYGWSKITSNTFDGVCRSVRSFGDNSGNRYIAVGTNSKLYIYSGGTLYNITPIRNTTTPTSPFTTTSGSATVTVTDINHNSLVGDTVNVSGATEVNGITLDGDYVVQTVVDTSKYTVTAAVTASGNGSGGGTPTLKYELSIGPVNSAISTGWGTSSWSGSIGWGEASVGSTVVIMPRIWFLDNFGQTLLCAPRGGTLYKWDPSVETISGRATVVSGAPLIIEGGIIVNPQNRHVVCVAASYNATPEPTQIIWSDQEDYTEWTPSISNLAGSLSAGGVSRIFSGQLGNNQIVLIGDTRVYGMNYIGSPYVFGLSPIDTPAGLISTNAATSFNGLTCWMGTTNFYIYNGAQITPINSSVKDYVYSNMNMDYKDKVFAFSNAMYNEVWWFYPSLASTEPDSYVSYNTIEQVWTIGKLNRTAATPKGVFDYPILADSTTSFIYYHENGTTADGAVIPSYITSGPIDIDDGEQFAVVDRVIPDFQIVGGAELSVLTRKYPNDTPYSGGTFTITSSTTEVYPRTRGRSVQFTFTSLDVGNPEKTSWRLGELVISYKVSGRQ